MKKGIKIHTYVTIFWIIPIIGYYLLNNGIEHNIQNLLIISYFLIHFIIGALCYLEGVYTQK